MRHTIAPLHLARAVDWTASQSGRYARDLQVADERYYPAVRQHSGGGIEQHVQPDALRNLCLSFAASSPSDAASVVRELLTYRSVDIPNRLAPRSWLSDDLGQTVSDLVETFSDPMERQAYQAIAAAGGYFYLEVSIAWGRACLIVDKADGKETPDQIWRRPPDLFGLAKPSKVERVSFLPLDLFLAAGECWEDTKRQQKDLPLSSAADGQGITRSLRKAKAAGAPPPTASAKPINHKPTAIRQPASRQPMQVYPPPPPRASAESQRFHPEEPNIGSREQQHRAA